MWVIEALSEKKQEQLSHVRQAHGKKETAEGGKRGRKLRSLLLEEIQTIKVSYFGFLRRKMQLN